jgi:SAM-dependent methyltransferase
VSAGQDRCGYLSTQWGACHVVTFADSKTRFSSRVADYVRYRPHYPVGLIDLLRVQCGLCPDHVIADIGCGTGILAELFLENGNEVFGVEPSRAMRSAGEEYLSRYPRFTSIDGSAEATTLSDSSIDFVTAGQAFHWFDPVGAYLEFSRMLRKDGWIAIVRNKRRSGSSDFAKAYEQLLIQFGTDYRCVRDSHPRVEDIQSFFRHNNFITSEIPTEQVFDLDGLKGRLLSNSYTPQRDHENFISMMAELDNLFTRHQENDRVTMEYSTMAYLGQLSAVRKPTMPGSGPS